MPDLAATVGRWTDVEMPPGVAALPRNARGVPVSWTVAWSSEMKPRVDCDPCLEPLGYGAAPALFHGGRQGDGEPILTHSDVARARRVAVTGHCQVCGEQLPGPTTPPWRDPPRWLVDLRNFGQSVTIGGTERPLIVDGWTCEPCLRYSMQVCPGLAARAAGHRGDGLRILRVRSAVLLTRDEFLRAGEVLP